MAFRNNSYRLDFFRPGAAAASFTGFARNLASRHPTNLATISANHYAVYTESRAHGIPRTSGGGNWVTNA